MFHFRSLPRCTHSLYIAAFCAVLAGCSSGLSAVVQSAQRVMPGGSSAGEVRLDPRYRYLRATVEGQPAYLALGYEETISTGTRQVYYTGSREAVKFQGGRLVGASGVATEWRQVKLTDVPSWHRALTGARWTRLRDVMPGYHYGVQDTLTVKHVPPPRRTALQRIDPAQLTWFEETMTTNVPEAALPPAIYGVDMRGGREEVVYGEQCLSKELCFTWQKWPVEGEKRTTDEHR